MRKSLAVAFCLMILCAVSVLMQDLPPAGSLVGSGHKSSASEWTADDIITAEQASGMQISPDCRWAVWVKSVGDKEQDKNISNLVLSSLTEKKEIQLTRGNISSSDAEWSPDGQYISFITSRPSEQTSKNAASSQLWLINPFGGEPWKITDFTREISDYVWIDSDTIIFSAEEDPTLYENSHKTDDSRVIEDEAHAPPVRLYKYAVKSKKVTPLTENTDRIQAFAVSPDGRHAVTTHERSLRYDYDNRDKPYIYLYDLTNGQQQQIFNESRFNINTIHWAPDGSGFYASNNFKENPRYLWATVTEMYYFDLKSNTPVKVELDWENGLTGGFIVTDNGFLALLANGVRNKAARFIHDGNKWSREWLTGANSENIFGFTVGKDNKMLLYNYSTASRPPQWYRAELNGSRLDSPVQVTNLNENLQRKQIAKTETIHWKGARDEEVEGILYYPHNYQPGKKYPLVLMIHGGPTLMDSDAWKETWTYPHNLYAQQGAFVLAPNYHGSSNYGTKWSESIAGGNYYDLEVPDIEKGVDYLIARGLVDPDKLGTLGWSNGSLLTIALTTRTTRYKAAGAGAGVVDWTSDWANAYFGASFNNYYFGKSPLEDPQRYLEKSPFFKLDRVETPTIIFFGEKDTTVAPSQGWMHYRALQQLGKTDVKFVMFPGERHSFQKLSHQKRKIEEELAWFDKYLFKSGKEPENEALKADSPLAIALKRRNIKRSGNDYGQILNGKIIPEIAEFRNYEIGRFEVTRTQFAQFDPSYKFAAGTGNYPANNITLEQAKNYCTWLSRLTGSNYRLLNENEAEVIYQVTGDGQNTLDYWAGYRINPDDAARLKPLIDELKKTGTLLKEVGSFKGEGPDELVFDLGGNVAEWADNGRIYGGNAEMPSNKKGQRQVPDSEYTGFRVLKDSAK